MAQIIGTAHVKSRPARIPHEVMLQSRAARQQLIANPPRKRNIQRPVAMNVPNLRAPVPKFRPAKPVWIPSDTRPSAHFRLKLLQKTFATVQVSHANSMSALKAQMQPKMRHCWPRALNVRRDAFSSTSFTSCTSSTSPFSLQRARRDSPPCRHLARGADTFPRRGNPRCTFCRTRRSPPAVQSASSCLSPP